MIALARPSAQPAEVAVSPAWVGGRHTAASRGFPPFARTRSIGSNREGFRTPALYRVDRSRRADIRNPFRRRASEYPRAVGYLRLALARSGQRRPSTRDRGRSCSKLPARQSWYCLCEPRTLTGGMPRYEGRKLWRRSSWSMAAGPAVWFGGTWHQGCARRGKTYTLRP